MRVLQVVPNIVSAKLFLWDLMAYMGQAGIDTHCACSTLDTFSRKRVGMNFAVHNIEFARGMNVIIHWNSAHELSRLVSQIKPDIIHAHFSAAIFTSALAHRPNWPVSIGTFQGVTFLNTAGIKSAVMRFAEVWAAHRMDKVWVLTEDDYQGMNAIRFPTIMVEKQRSFGFGCDLSRFDPDKQSQNDRARIRAELGLKPDDFVFCYVGRFAQFKGFDLTVRAFTKLAHSVPNARLLLIGVPDPLHPTGLSSAEEKVLERSSAIIRLGFKSEVQKYLAIAHTMVFPSTREGVAVCLMEALAMGVPVITRNSRGCRDVVRHQVDGLVLDNISVDSLASAMKRIMDDNNLQQSFSQEALKGRERFSRQRFIHEQVQTYHNLLNERSQIQQS